MSQARVSESPARVSHDWDYRWQQAFALSGLAGVVLCLLAWEVFWPQPPDFAMSGPQTAQFYASHQTSMLIGITLSASALYMAIPLVLQPDQTKAFGIFIFSILMLVVLSAFSHWIVVSRLAGGFSF